VQNKYDKRSKDPTLHAMQVIEARKWISIYAFQIFSFP
jgi:hypothetical protein